MLKINSQILADPVIIIVAIMAVAAIGVLVWAIANWKKLKDLHSGEGEELASYEEDETPPPARAMESPGVFEAQLQEITCQLTEIGKRLGDMENADKAAPTDSDKIMNFSVSPEIERKLQSIEAKLEGIHKLLIALTDSGGSTGS